MRFVLVLIFLICSIAICYSKVPDAENLWGNPIWFNQSNLNIVIPESSSNCGYCLVDGEWIKANYGEMQEETNGGFYLQMLFNTQRDILSFAKHYDENDQYIINYPYTLWKKYHKDGYPFLYALKNNKLIYSDISTPYSAKYDSLGSVFWGISKKPIILTSPSHMANTFLTENERNDALFVVEDSIQAKKARPIEGSYSIKTLEGLTETDWHKNITFYLSATPRVMASLMNLKIPFQVVNHDWQIGKYHFNIDSTFVYACFPNPYQTEKYIMLQIVGTSFPQKIDWQQIGSTNWIDFAFIQPDRDNSNEASFSLFGQFSKNGNDWIYADSLAYGQSLTSACVGSCPIPSVCTDTMREPEKLKYTSFDGKNIQRYRIDAESRFPRLAVANNIVYQTFEHKGDVYMAIYKEGNKPVIVPVDVTSADSYDAVPILSDNHVWVFYLKKIFGFYRLIAKYQSNGLWSEEITISEKLPCDVILPAVTAHGSEITVCWTIWQANCRRMYQRKIINTELQQIKKSLIVESNDYEDAWASIMQYDDKGNLWKSWNQHYPYPFCVVASQNDELPEVVSTKDEYRLFGYPTLTLDSKGQPWVFFEDETALYSLDQDASILVTNYDKQNNKWSVPFNLIKDKNFICQSPVSCTDNNGRIWVLWSERSNSKNWQLKCRFMQQGEWSNPITITTGKYSSRSPEIAVSGNQLVITYHSNLKAMMKSEILFLDIDKLIGE